jgi:signal peptidase II
MRAYGAILATLVSIVDQATKWWIVDFFAARPSIVEATPFFNLVLVMNRGVSFGLVPIEATWGPWMFAGIAAVIVVILVIWLARAEQTLLAIGIGLVIGGAIGNVIDRLRYGGVVDFLDFHLGSYHWPAFNVADASIVVGVGALLYTSLFTKDESPKNDASA